ncbi:MAG: Spy/CpxP family protein refolding chaperone [Pseudomonadota bacterium]|uniref:Spy/CpxP family protein refolding chaperone n=1 Tax=Polaromonas sp. TaxID=1869339 RepID=UPI00184A1491|nr:Spy/CpxP family protein refolding chaperone [Polaromonas sp.]MBA3593908.1 Spy/CpxP family protein refolding chaperone [Polaromonas sp.]MDQ3271927.1 Spy/CpxP family protein refolding chaperone [Pseudomonadota bacterium]
MKRFIKRTLLGLFGGALIIGSLGACSHRGQGWQSGAEASPESRARMVEKVGAKLDLDAAQKQKLTVLADKLQTQRAALRGAQDPRATVQGLFAGNKLDQAGASKLITEKAAALQAGSPEVIAAAADFFDNLRPEQQQKVREFMQRGSRWGHRG